MLVVNRLIPMSVVDGPGNRFAIFLQGCNFNCQYCHNPETIGRCVQCGHCVDLCPAGALSRTEAGRVAWDESLCIDCDRCVAACPHGASPKLKYMETEALLKEIDDARPFIQGITVSGGECTLQAEALIPLFEGVHARGLTALLDSNGGIDFSRGTIQKLIDISDGVMLDIKAWDAAEHVALTGRDNAVVKANLAYLASIDKLLEVRLVLLEGRDHEKTIRGIADILGEKIQNVAIKLIDYRPFGVRANNAAHLAGVGRKEKEQLIHYAEDLGFRAVIDI